MISSRDFTCSSHSMVTVVVTGHSSRRSTPPRWTPTGNGLQRGQFCWPPLGRTVGRQRAATWPPLGRISWPPTVLHSSRFAGVRTDLSRACAKASKFYVPVPAAGTSSMCHRCGEKGIRESQAVFRCPSCEWDGGADLNGACNVTQRTWARFQTERAQKVRRPGRSSLDGRTGRNPSRVARRDVSGAISKKCEPNSGHHRI